jgi:hypothetical protein
MTLILIRWYSLADLKEVKDPELNVCGFFLLLKILLLFEGIMW